MALKNFSTAWRQRYGDASEAAPTESANAQTLSLLEHRSVRSFLNTPLPPGALEKAIAAAQSASSSSNLQPWSVIAVRDPERKARLSKLANDQVHIRDAPLLLVWIVDLARLSRIAKRAGAPSEALDYLDSYIVGLVDVALAAQNAVVSLEATGLGVVYIGALRNNAEAVARELHLPPQTAVAFGLTVGTPDPSRPTFIKPRLAQSQVLHHERYGAPNEEAAVAQYDKVFSDFQESQGLPARTWTSTVLQRIESVGALHGREQLRDLLARWSLPLK
ncbi:NADPH-dependent oxidoreductase [Acetobacter nitrogenifigens]|uniref:Nitroreductase n=2 Tax=Acetobacter nitrogenifigens TaxID=285268 RepID=A0A511XFJ8_9PROT|nr:NADPH-dependent oxidoreductase [Acetobacter nitrogenifigens]GEN61733.1 nitroreductase [Acetobacter nitrogenifigens DSM 23921 = NBRC 105050]